MTAPTRLPQSWAHTLCHRLESLDPRVQAEVVPEWPYVSCDLCGYLDCRGNAHLSWTPLKSTRDHTATVNALAHLEPLLTGFLLHTTEGPILIQVGAECA